jgi:hypothetical protein
MKQYSSFLWVSDRRQVLNSISIEFVTPKRLARLIELNLKKYSKYSVGKHLSDAFLINNWLNQREC